MSDTLLSTIRESTIIIAAFAGFTVTYCFGINGAFVFLTAYILGGVSVWCLFEERKKR